jgi:hypothetical protein
MIDTIFAALAGGPGALAILITLGVGAIASVVVVVSMLRK